MGRPESDKHEQLVDHLHVAAKNNELIADDRSRDERLIELEQGVRDRALLDGAWHYALDPDSVGEEVGYTGRDYALDEWETMELPINWFLTEVGEYFGGVWFARDFVVPDGMADRDALRVQFGAVDYIADVWLNGTYLGRHEGIFGTFAFDVTDEVDRNGKNRVTVRVRAPRDSTEYVRVEGADEATPLSEPFRKHWPEALSLIKGYHIDDMDRPGAQTKYGQDGNSGGIWQSVELVGTGSLYFNNVKITPTVVEGGEDEAIAAFDIEIENTAGHVVTTDVDIEIDGYNFESETFEKTKEVVVEPGLNTLKLVKTIPEPERWWTWDMGDQNLYQARITVDGDEFADRFGVREFEIDDDGIWYLNGKRIFARGMRYLSSIWIGEMDWERYEEDLSRMKDLHINAIRLGSHVEKPEFYHLADEMGFLMWQVFPLHYCVSDSDDLIDRASDQIREMVRQFYNHPSITIWSTFKEPEVYGLSNPPNNYGRLCEILKQTATDVDPVRWVHKGDYRDGVQNFTPGYVQPTETDVESVPLDPMIVEFGVHSIPGVETLERFIPDDDLYPPDWDTWEYFGNYYSITIDNQQIDLGDSIEDFVENSQAFAARMNAEQIEFLRQRKYDPVGSLFQYFWNDNSPMIGCGILDYYRNPFQEYDAIKQVYTPVLVSLEWLDRPRILGRQKRYEPGETFSARIWVINDYHESYPDATLDWKICDDEGETVLNEESSLTVPADDANVADTLTWEIPPEQSGVHTVKMAVYDEAGETLSENDFELEVA